MCGIYILLYEGELIEHINDLLTHSITDKARDMDFDEYRKFKRLYESMRKGDKTEVIRRYAMMSEEPSSSMTVCEDTVLHMAINMRHESIASEILKHHIKDPGTLTRKNVFGDTILHEAASTNMTKLVKELLEKEPLLLSMPNKYDEMPLFKAAQFGHIEMFKLLAGEVENEGPEKAKHHLSRSDKTNILHMTILAEFFGRNNNNSSCTCSYV